MANSASWLRLLPHLKLPSLISLSQRWPIPVHRRTLAGAIPCWQAAIAVPWRWDGQFRLAVMHSLGLLPRARRHRL